jgi:predicted amidophosphoribosyltransferase
VLVDDVLTTGATLTAAATTLRGAGAGHVIAITAGRTPLKVPSPSADA